MTALIVLALFGIAAGIFHYFFIKAVDGFTGYGQGGSFREWQEFERDKLQTYR